MNAIVPVSSLGRVQEHGRLRFGVKTAKAMKVLDAWRFTSTDVDALAVLAERYGGEPHPWNEPKAAVQGQWELLSEAAEIEVLLPAEDALSVNYESWVGSGCTRRCDGVDCTVPTGDGDQAVVDCLCSKEGAMQCKPKVRLSVILPGIPFRGVWRMETGSWNAAHEMSAMEGVVAAMQGRGILKASLALEKRSRVTPKGKRNFTVPRLEVRATPEELASGQAGLPGIPVVAEQRVAIGTGATVEEVEGRDGPGPRAFDSHPVDASPPSPSSFMSDDDEIVDAHIVDDELTDPDMGITDEEKEWMGHIDVIEATSGLARDAIVRGLCLSASEGLVEYVTALTDDDWAKALGKARDLAKGEHEVTGVAPDGRLLVKRARP